MAGALGVGPGVLALLLLWAVAGLLLLALLRARRARVAAVPLSLGAAALTAALLLFPRDGPSPAPPGAPQIVDTFLIGRFVLLAVMSLVFLGCLFLFLIYHLMEPLYAKPLHSS
ncbi:hypothetical protein HGM15179_012347 [Zosterops borbonicus]|uniref:Transmembrane protein 218 n=1 Tax=Zosterops borbonicus TaxID=364589 RepID=A0A8K1GB33_9PASS|nr:hypothetical protein HGM15179_012347 [Zosterops borbonicus]